MYSKNKLAWKKCFQFLKFLKNVLQKGKNYLLLYTICPPPSIDSKSVVETYHEIFEGQILHVNQSFLVPFFHKQNIIFRTVPDDLFQILIIDLLRTIIFLSEI